MDRDDVKLEVPLEALRMIRRAVCPAEDPTVLDQSPLARAETERYAAATVALLREYFQPDGSLDVERGRHWLALISKTVLARKK